MSATTSSATDANSGFLTRVSEGRQAVHELFQDDGHRERMKSAISDVFSNPITAFFLRARQLETQVYDFTAHNWRDRKNEDGDAETDVNKAVRDFLVNRVETLATRFVGETQHDAKLVQEYLLAKLGAGKFESTADFIENGQAKVVDAHKKLASSLTKIYENRFKSIEEKAKKDVNDGDGEGPAAAADSSSADLETGDVPRSTTPPVDDEGDASSSSDESDHDLIGRISRPGTPEILTEVEPPAGRLTRASDDDASPTASPLHSDDDESESQVGSGNESEDDHTSAGRQRSSSAPSFSPQTLLDDDADDIIPPAEASSSISKADVVLNVTQVDSDDSDVDEAAQPPAAASSSSARPPITDENSDDEIKAEVAASASSSSADELDDTDSVASDDDAVGDQDDSTNEVKKKRSAFAQFFIRIGNGIEKFFISIWTFIKKIFS